MKRRIAIVLGGFAAAGIVLTVASLAVADVQVNGQWVFRGSLYTEKPAREEHRLDPLNVIFYKGGGFVDNTRVNDHLNADWDTRQVGGRPWRKHNEIFPHCKDGKYALWRHLPGRNVDLADQHGTTARFAHICGNQHHARLWDDYEHSKGRVHERGQWVISGFHHEKVIFKRVLGHIKTPGHKPDRDWDRVRVEVVKAMRRHCSYRRWKYHPGAHHWYQGYQNFGYIARISMHHVADGGCDGK